MSVGPGRRHLYRTHLSKLAILSRAVILALLVVTAACTSDGAGRGQGRDGATDPAGRDQASGSSQAGAAGSSGLCGGGGGDTGWRPVAAPPGDGSRGVVVEDLLPGAGATGDTGSASWTAVGARVVGGADNVAPAAWRLANDGWVADRTVASTLFGREQRLIGVGRHDGHLAAMGLVYSDFEARPRPSAWAEHDGVWREVPTLREVFGGPRTQGMTDMASGELGFVVVGARDDRRGQQMAGVWRSPDGLDWTPPPQDTPLTGASGEVVTPLGVAIGPSGVVVVGTSLPLTDVLPDVEDGAVWWSGDGRRWERVHAGAVFGGPGTQQPTVVTWSGSAFVAVGSAADEVGGRLRPAAWVSPDGRSWRRAPVDAFGGGSEADARLTSLVSADGCMIAGGLVGTSPRLWTSTDGLAWTPMQPPALELDAHGKVLAAADQGELLVVLSEPTSSRVWKGVVPHVG